HRQFRHQPVIVNFSFAQSFAKEILYGQLAVHHLFFRAELLVGVSYDVETLYNWDKKYIFGALVRGEDSIVICGLGGRNSDTLTCLHPYYAQTYKRELSPAMPPQPQKGSLLDELEATQKEVAATNAAKATGEKPRKLAVAEI
ncbi:MAG: hypothetical protein LBK41_06920, partial [Clostridiales bacterium]|nr:hypothetical protein [Clostridiales bacterium]